MKPKVGPFQLRQPWLVRVALAFVAVTAQIAEQTAMYEALSGIVAAF